MNYVEPIRDRKKTAQIKNFLRRQRHYRDLLLFVVGINTALRKSDLLQLKIGQFLDDNEHIKGRFQIEEQKHGKRQDVAINRGNREALGDYLVAYPHMAKEPSRLLFFNPYTNQPIKRGQA
jgi:integrase